VYGYRQVCSPIRKKMGDPDDRAVGLAGSTRSVNGTYEPQELVEVRAELGYMWKGVLQGKVGGRDGQLSLTGGDAQAGRKGYSSNNLSKAARTANREGINLEPGARNTNYLM